MVQNEDLIQAYISGQTINQLHIKYAADGEKVDFDGSGTDRRLIYDIGNDSIHFEQFKLIESICSDSELRLGGCEASSVEFRIVNDNISFTGKWLTIYHTLINEITGTEISALIGYFKVYSDKLTRDKQHRDITAYNSMYYIGNTDISQWYNGLPFPVTLKWLRDNLFYELGIEQEYIELPNDDKLIYMVDRYDELFAIDVLKDICEVNGCFGMITKTNRFRYVILKDTIGNFAAEPDYTIPKSEYRQNGLTYEDFYTSGVDAVKFIQKSGQSVTYTAAGANTYICSMRVLYFGNTPVMLQTIASVIHSALDNLVYIPYNLTGIGNLALECGDLVEIMAGNGSIKTYIFERTFEGIQSLKDVYSANGKETLERTKSPTGGGSSTGGAGGSSGVDFYMQTYTNTAAYNINQNSTQIISFRTTTNVKTNIGFSATIPLHIENSIDGEAFIEYYKNGVYIENSQIIQYINSGNNVITLTNFFSLDAGERVTLTVKIRLQAYSSIIPTGFIAQEGIKAIIFGKGFSEVTGWDGTVYITQDFYPITIKDVEFVPFQENVQIELKDNF